MFRIASAMLAYRRVRFLVTTLGIGALFWLSIAQVGLLVGWCNTIAALIDEGTADLWVMAERTPAYDYGTLEPIMGDKTLFTHESSERKDLDVLQVIIDLGTDCQAPVGLQVDVVIETD